MILILTSQKHSSNFLNEFSLSVMSRKGLGPNERLHWISKNKKRKMKPLILTSGEYREGGAARLIIIFCFRFIRKQRVRKQLVDRGRRSLIEQDVSLWLLTMASLSLILVVMTVLVAIGDTTYKLCCDPKCYSKD